MPKFAWTPMKVALATLLAVGLLACNDDDPAGNGNGNGNGPEEAVLTGDLTGTRTLSADTTYTVIGFFNIQPGATLTVPAGTTILSDQATRGSIVTLRCTDSQPSGRLVAQGTAASPVRFAPAGSSPFDRGDAGGIVLNGCAPINVPGGTASSEGVNQPFGGTNPADDSGSIQFLTIAFGGVPVTPDNEINGLTLAGVGSGTVIQNVQTHFIADDGFEWFGGTVNGRNLVSSGNDDDAFDCDFGWNGTVQFLLAVQDANLSNRGVECDNDGDGSENAPITDPKVWNATWIGAGVRQANSEINDGLYLRRNINGTFRNLIVSNFGNAGVVFDGPGVWNHVVAGTLVLDNVLFFNNQCLESAAACANANTAGLAPAGDRRLQTAAAVDNIVRRDGGEYVRTDVDAEFADATLVVADPEFGNVSFSNPINGAQPDPRPASGSPALDPANAATPSGTGLDGSAVFLGAFNTTLWIDGWTIWNTQ